MPKAVVGESVFYNMDCVSGCQKHVPDGSVDLIITDPPYGIGGDKLHKHYNRDESYVVDGYVEVPAGEYGEFSRKWIKEAERILRPGGQIYVVSGYTNLHHILNALHETKLKEVNHIIWKYNFGVYTKTKYVSSHYHILYWTKRGGKPTFNTGSRYGLQEQDANDGSLNYQDREDVWIINREYKPGKEKNKNELPSALLTKMLQYSSNVGDTVCDLFLGGFSTAKIAIGLKRKAIGFELSKKIFDKKIREMRNIRQGYLLGTLRKPSKDSLAKSGKPWTQDEKKNLNKRFQELIKTGKTKKDTIQTLTKEFGRGRWGIEGALDAVDVISRGNQSTINRFIR
jgi:site-specific DNA-methyltransferase (adenine-specific)